MNRLNMSTYIFVGWIEKYLFTSTMGQAMISSCSTKWKMSLTLLLSKLLIYATGDLVLAPMD